MGADMPRELIVVRSMTDSDLGLFAAHRSSARSKQRAINVNATIAKRMLDEAKFLLGGGDIDCICVFKGVESRDRRHFGKIHKNWRLGGKKLEGDLYGQLDSKDFVLIRTREFNDGTSPFLITFISKALDRVIHAGIAAIVEPDFSASMACYASGEPDFRALEQYCPLRGSEKGSDGNGSVSQSPPHPKISIPTMPRDPVRKANGRTRSIDEKLKTPHILAKMLQVSSDLSAPAQLQFMETVKSLAEQLRFVLLETKRIIKLPVDHANQWRAVAGKTIGFVDGGLANMSMLGSVPVAARVGGYVVTPSIRTPDREQFFVLKCLIDELYSSSSSGGVYEDSFPDIGALRDAARISIEAAGAVRLLADNAALTSVMVHGALVNPVSRYTDIMRDGQVRHRFPDFSDTALKNLLPPTEPPREGRERNFISVHHRQLQLMAQSRAVVCGVIERESTTSSVCRAVLNSLDDAMIHNLLPIPPAQWKQWFRRAIDPSEDEDLEGQRITDSLLFRCVLEPGEVLAPVEIDRNEMRRAPAAWQHVLVDYPKPFVSYLHANEWAPPIRVEIFKKDLDRFTETASLILHCALLLPQYAFPMGLDIVDKFARIPNWMSRPVNTRTAVLALKQALDSGDQGLFDAIRQMLCGSSREWLLRPGILR